MECVIRKSNATEEAGAFQFSGLMEEGSTDSKDISCSLISDVDQCNLLNNCIRAIVQARLFDYESSMSDGVKRICMNGLLHSMTTDRNGGPKNRLPSRSKRNLKNSQSMNIFDDATTVSMAANDTSSAVNANANTSTVDSFTTFDPAASVAMSPDSGCILEDRDYPHQLTPIKDELTQLGQRLSPVPQLNLRESLDEKIPFKVGNSALPSFVGNVRKLDLSSVLESADHEVVVPIYKEIIRAVQSKTPPRSSKRRSCTKQLNKKLITEIVKLPESASEQGDCDIANNCGEAMEQTRDQITQILQDNRRNAGRPCDFMKMSCEELKEEKISMQRELLKFEARYGRPTTKESKRLMREVYDRYRVVKRTLSANERIEIDEDKNVAGEELNDSFLVTSQFLPESCEESEVIQEGALETRSSDLLQRLQELRPRYKRLSRILQDFEKKRRIEDPSLERRVMRVEYEEYRTIKSEVHELEIALAKRGVKYF